MKIRELLTEDKTPFDFIKGLSRKFKELAAEYDITIIAGMGWPKIQIAGGWIGGGLGQKGGHSAKNTGAEDDDTMMPIEIRRKGFLAAVTLVLQDLIKDGHTVMVSAGAVSSSKIPVDHDSVGQVLRSSLKMAKPPATRLPTMPCIAWFVSLPTDLVGTTNLSISVAAHADYEETPLGMVPSQEPLRAQYHVPMDSKEAASIGKKFAIFKTKNYAKSQLSKGTWTEGKHTAEWTDFQDHMIEYVLRNTDQKLPPNVSSVYIDVSKSAAVSRVSKRISADDPLAIIVKRHLT